MSVCCGIKTCEKNVFAQKNSFSLLPRFVGHCIGYFSLLNRFVGHCTFYFSLFTRFVAHCIFYFLLLKKFVGRCTFYFSFLTKFIGHCIFCFSLLNRFVGRCISFFGRNCVFKLLVKRPLLACLLVKTCLPAGRHEPRRNQPRLTGSSGRAINYSTATILFIADTPFSFTDSILKKYGFRLSMALNQYSLLLCTITQLYILSGAVP